MNPSDPDWLVGENLPDGATPIDPEEMVALIPPIQLQRELNVLEALGILEATEWAGGNRRFLKTLLSDTALRTLHKRMFGAVWQWAGTFRATQKSVGVEAYRIGPELRNLVADTEVWISHETYTPTEIAARFHHRLVQIHPFVNGNGRHARLATDLLCEREGWELSDWGASDLGPASDVRSRYIDSLRQADRYDFVPLTHFMYPNRTTSR